MEKSVRALEICTPPPPGDLGICTLITIFKHLSKYFHLHNIFCLFRSFSCPVLYTFQPMFDCLSFGVENWHNLCSLLLTSLSGINNTFTSRCHGTIISENWTSRRVTIQTLDVLYMTHLYAIVYPWPVFYHLGSFYLLLFCFSCICCYVYLYIYLSMYLSICLCTS